MYTLTTLSRRPAHLQLAGRRSDPGFAAKPGGKQRSGKTRRATAGCVRTVDRSRLGRTPARRRRRFARRVPACVAGRRGKNARDRRRAQRHSACCSGRAHHVAVSDGETYRELVCVAATSIVFWLHGLSNSRGIRRTRVWNDRDIRSRALAAGVGCLTSIFGQRAPGPQRILVRLRYWRALNGWPDRAVVDELTLLCKVRGDTVRASAASEPRDRPAFAP